MDNLFALDMDNNISKSRQASSGSKEFYTNLRPLLKAYEIGLIEDYVLKQAISRAISRYVESEIDEIVIKKFEETLGRL